MTHIRVGKLTIIGSDNGLSPGRHQAIIWTNTGILLIWPLGTNFNEILIGNQTFSFKKKHLKKSSAKWRPFCLGLNVLTAGPVHTRNLELVIIRHANALAHNRDSPPAVAVLITKKWFCQCSMTINSCEDIFWYSRRDFAKFRGMRRLNSNGPLLSRENC